MNDTERMRILELLEQGKITAAEAADLLSALDQRGRERDRRERGRVGFSESPPPRPHAFRVRVTDTAGRRHADFSIPIGMVGLGIGLGRRFRMGGGPPIDVIREAIRTGRRGTIFDVSGNDGERVEIIIE
jgi:hypothetical protein